MKRGLYIALAVFLAMGSMAPRAVAKADAVKSFNVASTMTSGLEYEQRLGKGLPLELPFVDQNGNDVKLGDYFKQGPVVLVLAYYECPSLCTVVIRETFHSIQVMRENRGDPYSVVVVSINPKENAGLAAEKRDAFLKAYKKSDLPEKTHFLVGQAESIESLAKSIGFQYRWDEPTQQYVHPSGMLIATPEGKISRYLMGVRFNPRDVRLGLVEASQGKIGNVVDKMLLFCYQYDAASGKYGFWILGALRLFAGVTVTALGGYVWTSLRRERRRRRDELANTRASGHVR